MNINTVLCWSPYQCILVYDYTIDQFIDQYIFTNQTITKHTFNHKGGVPHYYSWIDR